MPQTIHYTFCKYCHHQNVFSESGGCPECGKTCTVYPEFMKAFHDFEAACQALYKKYDLAITYEYRGSLELGTWSEYLIVDVFEKTATIFQEKTSAPADLLLSPEQYPVVTLPKLDIVILTFKHIPTGATITIHDDHYSLKFYQQESAWWTFSISGLREVLNCGVPGTPAFASLPQDIAEKLGEFPPLFALFPLLAKIETRNALWYAALAQGYYVIPVQPLF